MGGDFGPIDSLVQEILGTARFLDNLVTRTGVILWVAGRFARGVLLLGIILFLR